MTRARLIRNLILSQKKRYVSFSVSFAFEYYRVLLVSLCLMSFIVLDPLSHRSFTRFQYIKFSDVVNRNACKSLFWIKFISLLTKSNKFNFLENMSLVSRNKFSYFFFHEAYSKLFSLFVAERYPIDMIHVSEKKFFFKL